MTVQPAVSVWLPVALGPGRAPAGPACWSGRGAAQLGNLKPLVDMIQSLINPPLSSVKIIEPELH
jgi:hypothetical protein